MKPPTELPNPQTTKQDPTYEPPLAAALHYLARGWSIVPLRPRDKKPFIRWEQFQGAFPSEADVFGWLQRWPDANVGIVTGSISKLIVLDIDPKHGGDDSLEHLVRRFGPIAATVEARTGGGGRHLYFEYPGYPVRNRVGFRQGIDLRGEGGYVVAPPSVHPSGERYTWLPGHSPEERRLAPLPGWLVTATSASGSRRTVGDWRKLVREGVPEGQRNSTIASLTGHLLWHGVDPQVTLELLLAWNRTQCQPPLDDAEVAQIVHNITRLHDQDSFSQS
jgi:hypothetical protein